MNDKDAESEISHWDFGRDVVQTVKLQIDLLLNYIVKSVKNKEERRNRYLLPLKYLLGRTVEIANYLRGQAAWLGSYGTAAFGEAGYPKPGAVIMQYTGLSQATGAEPPTYACVGTSDGIAYYGTMERRIRKLGINAEIEIFEGLPHGFGLGEETVAEGWFDNAVQFWEDNMVEYWGCSAAGTGVSLGTTR